MKPENLLVVEEETGKSSIRIADFGLACCDATMKKQDTEDGNNSEGTFPYMAVEVLLEIERHTFAADMWALGIIYGELMAQATFIRGNNRLQVLRSIFKACRPLAYHFIALTLIVARTPDCGCSR